MLKREITYKDFLNKERTESFYFNLTEEELLVLEFSVGTTKDSKATLSERIKNVVETQRASVMMEFFRNFILTSYGEIEDGGRFFVKSDETRERFAQSAAYAALFNELATDSDAASAFVQSVVGINLETGERTK